MSRRETFSPHILAGAIGVSGLKKIAEVAEKHRASAIKLSGEIIVVFENLPDKDSISKEMGLPEGKFSGGGIRGVKVCSATTFCDLNLQDALTLAIELDEKYFGMETPSKFTIAVSGCPRCCSEPLVKDIGIVSLKDGFKITAGGNAGSHPRIADEIAVVESSEEVKRIVENIVNFYKENGEKGKRLGRLMDEIGIENFKFRVLRREPS